MDKVFFSDSGLTSTSANHIANLAKELVQSVEKEVNNISLINSYVTLIGSNEKNLLSVGWKDLESLPSKMELLGQAHALMAWLREAIKAREAMLKEVEYMSIGDWAEQYDIQLPVAPKERHNPTREERIASLNIKERNRYYTLQARAAVLGKYIHPDGSFSKARANMMDKALNPNQVVGDGRDTLLYSYKPSCDKEVVEDMFFKLQAEHRSIQAELNGILHKIDEDMRAEALEISHEFQVAIEEYNHQFNAKQAEFSEFLKKETSRRMAFKIAIPNGLQAIYETVNNLGK